MVSRSLVAKFRSGEASEAEAGLDQPTVDLADTWLPAPRPGRQVKPHVVNVALVLMLFVDTVAELIISGGEYVYAEPFVLGAVFGFIAYKQAHFSEPSKKLLLISGWACVLLSGFCLWSFAGSLLESPVDVWCAVSSSILSAGFAAGAWYQLRTNPS